jgi:hypothetical protein
MGNHAQKRSQIWESELAFFRLKFFFAVEPA